MAAGSRTVYALDLDDIIAFPDSAHVSHRDGIQFALQAAHELKDTSSTPRVRRELDDPNRGKQSRFPACV